MYFDPGYRPVHIQPALLRRRRLLRLTLQLGYDQPRRTGGDHVGEARLTLLQCLVAAPIVVSEPALVVGQVQHGAQQLVLGHGPVDPIYVGQAGGAQGSGSPVIRSSVSSTNAMRHRTRPRRTTWSA